jgi:cellobiose-specific phosphotransferase system component IIC
MPPVTTPRLFHCADGLAIAQIGPVCVAIWRSRSVFSRFEIQRAALDACVQQNPGNVSFLCVVEAGSEPPDDDVRKASSKMITDHGTNLRCTACVIEGAGFRAAITRSVLSGMLLLIRKSTPIKMFESVPFAAQWIETEVPASAALYLAGQVELLRRKLDSNERINWNPRAHAGP